jgi:hypothetical protein
MALRAKGSAGVLVAALTVFALYGGPASALTGGTPLFTGADVLVLDVLGGGPPTATHTVALPMVVTATADETAGGLVGALVEPDVMGGGIRIGIDANRGSGVATWSNTYASALAGTSYTITATLTIDPAATATFATSSIAAPTIPLIRDAASGVRAYLEVDFPNACTMTTSCIVTRTDIKQIIQSPAPITPTPTSVVLTVTFTPTAPGSLTVRTGIIADASAIGGPSTSSAKGTVTGIAVTVTP